MGLAPQALRYLAREHKRQPFAGPVLTLGRQQVHASFEEAQAIVRGEGLTPTALPAGTDTRTNIQEWRGGPDGKNTSDTAFFGLLGLGDVLAVDYSAFESAEVVHDLNQPVPSELRNRFGLVVDGGTIEHVFDVRQCLSNIAAMLKPGGRVVHMAPANNYVNHGFYQFSPTFFFDYYAANRFRALRAMLVEHDLDFPNELTWDVFDLDGGDERITSNRPLLVFFQAEKTADSSSDVIPLQSFYRRAHADGPVAPAPAPARSAFRQLLRRVVPARARAALRRWIPGRDPTRKPWGLRRAARLTE